MGIVFHLVIMSGIYMILALSLNLLIGYAGLFSVGHGAFYGLGAYSAAILSTRFGLPFGLEVVVAATVSGFVGYVLGRPILRLRGDHLTLATFGLAVIAVSVFNNWTSLTRGPLGIRGIPKVSLFSFEFTSLSSYAILVGGCVVLTLMFLWRLTHSQFGKVLEAIREDDIAALAIGKDVTHFKVMSFVVASCFAGLAGVLYAHYVTYIDPLSFGTSESFLVFTMVVFGGMGSNLGVMAGAAVLVSLPELLRFVGLPSEIAAQMRDVIYGALIILVINWRPQGLIGKVRL